MKERINYLDRLKGIAILLVVFCHMEMLAYDSIAGNVIMSVSWCAVPCFFMVTGGLMNSSREFVFKKYFKRLLTTYLVLIFWKIVYLAVTMAVTPVELHFNEVFTYLFFFGSINGVNSGVMWFMDAYLATLIIYPISYYLLNTSRQTRRVLLFTMIVAFVGGIAVNSVNLILEVIARLIGCEPLQITGINAIIPYGTCKNTLFFYLLGAFFFRYRDRIQGYLTEKKIRKVIPALIFLCGIAGMLLIKYHQAKTFRWQGFFTENGYSFISTVLLSVGLYLVAQIYLSRGKMPILELTGKCTLGIYYIHYIMLWVVLELGIVDPRYYSIFTNIIKTVVITAICVGVTVVVRKIPVLKHTVQ